MDLNFLSVKAIIQGLCKKDFTCEEITKEYLNNIAKKDKEINAFFNIDEKQVLSQAKEIDKNFSQKKNDLPLAGLPIAVKDNILVKGQKCSAGSKMLENYEAPYDATVIKKVKQAGAFILGKTNLDEFACGSSGEHSAFSPCKNPNDLEFVAGGSSSGSAAAVAADMTPVAFGSDTAGSVRLPASFCGIVGFKPTYGAISRFGLIAMASSLDQIGILAKKTEDIEIIFDAIRGKDEMDSTSIEVPTGEKINSLNGLIVGLPKACFSQGIDKQVLDITYRAIEKLKIQGVNIKEIEMPNLEYGVACYYIIMPAELSSNLARYDGIKYGSSEDGIKDLIDLYFQTRGRFFGKEIKRRIMLGTYVLSSGYYDAYYLRALKVRTKIKMDFNEAFEKVDFVLTPTSPVLPFKLGQKIEDPLSLYMMDLLTVPANLAGLPSISLPVGKVGSLPVGVQIIAPASEDKKLLAVANLIEKIWTP
ncbi:Asp-tRNA(Asn)/Glu-tRNA(Gln) amidotransferase subunit GatA [Patescibacteria group bacterium]|nr:Asp-tRNA(Asn)/Glu-tRNA(Gln) amidotransferase subunit GatA [Patescibacteria group bacterium]MBU4023413.1 Asp-tRNA(Asn)/Glu-tRNA(Gln) amidotransferase subunit GatA [Patescibacteria group bacterium]MBU4078006.1 Asp-tRNA(Asn)/Glu-tRNA(Gln) amidotransferase subunit GatA [Patescibacteria group bacterium]